MFRRAPSRGGRGSRDAVDSMVVFWGGADFFVLLFFSIYFLFFERTRPAASMRPPCLIYLSTSKINKCLRVVRLIISVFLSLHDLDRSLGRYVRPYTETRQPIRPKDPPFQGREENVVRLTLGWVIDRSFTPIAH